MKKNTTIAVLIAMFMLIAPMMASAKLDSDEDAILRRPQEALSQARIQLAQAQTQTPRAIAPPPAASVFNEEKFNKKLNRLLAASREKFTKVVDDQNQAIMLKIENLSKKFDDSKTLNDSRAIALDGKLSTIDEQTKTLVSEAAEIKKLAKTNVEKITDLDAKLTGENGEFSKLKGELGATSNWSFVTMILGFIIVAVVVFIFFRSVRPAINAINRIDRSMVGIGTQIGAVQTAVEEIPAKIKAIDPMVIELDDVAGHHVTYTPPIEDDMYVTLYVPSTVTKPVTDPTKIIRTRTADRGAIRRSTRKVMAAYFVATAKGAPAPTTEQAKQQIALVNHLKDKQVSWS